jgi:hypothetical protein
MLINWDRTGKDPEQEMVKLSTYLGHANRPIPIDISRWFCLSLPQSAQLKCLVGRRTHERRTPRKLAPAVVLRSADISNFRPARTQLRAIGTRSDCFSAMPVSAEASRTSMEMASLTASCSTVGLIDGNVGNIGSDVPEISGDHGHCGPSCLGCVRDTLFGGGKGGTYGNMVWNAAANREIAVARKTGNKSVVESL